MTTYIPGFVMNIVVSYMNNEDLAKMAQVSKDWRNFVYRNSVWQYANWTPRLRYLDHFYDSNNIPSNARHLGMPTELCFLSWADKQLYQSNLPRQIFHEPDPVKFIHGLRKVWVSMRRPCVHVHHHKWSDVFKGRAFLDDLSESEKQRIAFRLLTFPTSPNMNAYRLWLETRALDCVSFSSPHAYTIDEPNKTDLLDMISAKHKDMCRARYELLNSMREKVLRNYSVSTQSLTRISKSEFDANDRAYIGSKMIVLDSITFAIQKKDPHPPLARAEDEETKEHVEPNQLLLWRAP